MAASVMPVPSVRFANILYATDFSPCSELALTFARAIAARFGSVLHLVHVLPPQPREPVTIDYARELDAELQASERQMTDMLLRRPLKGITHEVIMKHGPLWHVLEDVIHSRGIDLIVLGTHGRHGLGKLALGSVAEEVFRRAPCPVLTIGPHVVPDGLLSGQVDIVLYPTDFSSSAATALWYAVTLAQENCSKLLILHALAKETGASPSELQRAAEACRQRLQYLVPRGIQLWHNPELIAVHEPPADAVLRIANERQARLIVMGAKHSSISVSGHLPWPTAHRVVSEAPCPVLTVRS